MTTKNQRQQRSGYVSAFTVGSGIMVTKKGFLGGAGLALCAVLMAPAPTLAAEYYLRAESIIPDTSGPLANITMWGYSSCSSDYATCTGPSSPGPALTVPAGETVLTVHLLNKLTQPTSLVVNGLIKTMTPVWNTGETGSRPSPTARVRSFDIETAVDGTADYVWANVKPGTYLYQSGTQPQVQVQMGLYGAVTKNAAEPGTSAAQVYPGVNYDNQATLFYSEIDPELHAAVATGVYGTTDGPTSTLNYAPKYFLVNGKPYPGNAVISPTGNTGTTLLRLINAGLTTHVPMIQGTHWTVLAEDGKPYPYAAKQYTALLPAAKTMDVLLSPDVGGVVYPIMDRRLNLSNNGLAEGGMLTFLQYAAAGVSGALGLTDGNLAPAAVNDNYSAIAGIKFSVGAAEGVLANDDNTDGVPQPIRAVAAAGNTSGGSYVLNADGSFVYTPNTGYVGVTDSFTYRATDGKALSAPATVTIALNTPSAPTLPTIDGFNRVDATSLSANTAGTAWNQAATSTTPPDLQVTGGQAVAASSNLGGLAIWDTLFGAKQGAQLTLGTSPVNSALVLKASGGTATAPANFVRVRYEINNSVGEVVVATMLGGSNVSSYVRQVGFALASAPATLSAVVDAKGLVTVFAGGNYLGGVQLADVPAWKGSGKVGIQLQTQGASIDDFKGGSL
jgi:FtsP/CotA-like multicopper oxidase with cupredoxin domain